MNDKEKQIDYWLGTAIDDLESIAILFEGKKYVQALFFCTLGFRKNIKSALGKK
jgi:HEPN domain-containing protein